MRLTGHRLLLAVGLPVLAGVAVLSGCPATRTTSTVSTGRTRSTPATKTTGHTSAGTIAWVTDLAEARRKAAEENKPVMIDFYADWCHWCKQLDEDTYSDAAVQAKAKGFICAKVNADQDQASAREFGASGLPTIVWLDATGRELNRLEGYAPAEDFLREMDKALAATKPS